MIGAQHMPVPEIDLDVPHVGIVVTRQADMVNAAVGLGFDRCLHRAILGEQGVHLMGV
jgi:hypothetical protein